MLPAQSKLAGDVLMSFKGPRWEGELGLTALLKANRKDVGFLLWATGSD